MSPLQIFGATSRNRPPSSETCRSRPLKAWLTCCIGLMRRAAAYSCSGTAVARHWHRTSLAIWQKELQRQTVCRSASERCRSRTTWRSSPHGPTIPLTSTCLPSSFVTLYKQVTLLLASAAAGAQLMCSWRCTQRVSPAVLPSACLDTRAGNYLRYAITASSYRPTTCKSSKTCNLRSRKRCLPLRAIESGAQRKPVLAGKSVQQLSHRQAEQELSHDEPQASVRDFDLRFVVDCQRFSARGLPVQRSWNLQRSIGHAARSYSSGCGGVPGLDRSLLH